MVFSLFSNLSQRYIKLKKVTSNIGKNSMFYGNKGQYIAS